MIDKKQIANFENAVSNATMDEINDNGIVQNEHIYKDMKSYDQKIHDDSVTNSVNAFTRDSMPESQKGVRQQLESFLRKEYNVDDERGLGITEEFVDEAILFVMGELDGEE